MAGPERLVVGRIVKPHGITGEVSVEPISQAPGRFDPGVILAVDEHEMVVASVRPHQGRLLIRFEGVTDRNAAEELRGADLTIPSQAAAPLPEGVYYPHQLQGCEVRDQAGTRLGTLVRVEDNPAHDHWIVLTQTDEVMLPAVREFIVDVDLDARVVTVSPPEGLF